MPLGDSYVDAALDAVVASWPASGGKYRLYASNPQNEATPSDVELTSAGGYAGVTFAPANFSAASGNAKTKSSPVSFGTSSAAYSDTAGWWGITDTSGDLVYSDDFTATDVVAVDDAGVVVSFTPTISFGDT